MHNIEHMVSIYFEMPNSTEVVILKKKKKTVTTIWKSL